MFAFLLVDAAGRPGRGHNANADWCWRGGPMALPELGRKLTRASGAVSGIMGVRRVIGCTERGCGEGMDSSDTGRSIIDI